ncbi:MAG: sulfite exporter TauE/SafE family protein [Verrucomicrobiota bacterium]
MLEHLPLLVGFFVVALLYSSVGHGGASGYLAIMAIAGFAPEMIRPTALVLNMVVSLVGTLAFLRRGYFSGGLFWPFLCGAVPFAFLGGTLDLSSGVYRIVLGLALCFAIGRLFLPAPDPKEMRKPQIWIMVCCGALIGFLSGIVGVGGGIFLTPLVILMGWSDAKTAAAISAPFVFINSLAGLVGLQPVVADFYPHLPLLIVIVLVAGLLGSNWGSGRANQRQIRIALGSVLAVASIKLFLS